MKPGPADASSREADVTFPPRPYPGLRHFRKREWPIFFGREGVADEVAARIVHRRLVIVHGESGCGKSSLLRAGVFPRLEQENARGGLTWRTAETQPRSAPLANLAESLAVLDGRSGDEERILEIRRILNSGSAAPDALADVLLRGESDHVCVLIDQFEELFAFARSHGATEPRLLVQFLAGLLERPPRGLYAVVAMRSEFLGECAQFPGLADIVNRTQYLLARMTRSDLIHAIHDPAELYDGSVSRALGERLLVDAGGEQDELPLIQHALAVMYQQKTAADPGGAWRLELSDYPGPGAVADLVSKHADEIMQAAAPREELVVERLFRALTTINAEGQAIRRPQTFEQLVAATGAEESVLRRIIDAFRADGASFLTPYGDAPILATTLIDLSHEALIRRWRSIADSKQGWLVREFEDGLIWKSLLVQAESFERNRQNILSPATARERQHWLESVNAAWADRYGGGWDRVARLVTASVAAARDAERAERMRARRRVQLLGATAVALAVVVVIFVWLYRQQRDANERANVATANSIWNRLDFPSPGYSSDEVEALWDLAVAPSGVKDAFVRELTKLARVKQLAKHPGTVLRALALVPDVEPIANAVDRQLNDPAGRPEPELRKSLEILGPIVRADGPAMTPEQLAIAVKTLSTKAWQSEEPEIVSSTLTAIRALAEQLTAEQAAAIMPSRIESQEAVSTAEALAGRLADPQLPHHLAALLEHVRDSAQLYELAGLAAAAATLASSSTPQQARAAFSPVLSAICCDNDADRVHALSAVMPQLAGGASTRAAAELRPALAWFHSSVQQGQVGGPLDTAIQALVDKDVRPVDVAPDLGDGKTSQADAFAIQLSSLGLAALPCDAAQTQITSAFDGVLSLLLAFGPREAPPPLFLYQTFDISRLRALTIALSALTPCVQAQRFDDAITRSVNVLVGETLIAPIGAAAAIEALASRMDDVSAARILTVAISVIDRTVNEATLNVQLQSQLTRALRKLSPRISTASASATTAPAAGQKSPASALEWAIKALAGTELPRRQAAAAILEGAGGALTDAQADTCFANVISSIQQASQVTALEALTSAGAVCSKRLDPDARDRHATLETREPVRVMLKVAHTRDESVAAARALLLVLPHADSEEFVKAIVDALKYPNAAGEATVVLLDGLQERLQDAPGGRKGLRANLEWVSSNYRGVDLSGSPICPAPCA